MSEEEWHKSLNKQSEYYAESTSPEAAEGEAKETVKQANNAAKNATAHADSKEWQLISHLVQDIHKEKVHSRRWGVFFKSLGFVVVLAFIVKLWQDEPGIKINQDHIAVVKVSGVISSQAPANAKAILANVERALEEEDAKALVLHINSPGGSPVQAGIVYDEIKALQATYPDKPVYAVIDDVGASGAYYIAVAADKIYADKASVVGSIGVIASGFGFTGLIDNLGIERRTYTAGSNKDFLDPFKPEQAQQKQDMDKLLEIIHQQFIDTVKAGRGDRLAEDPDLFSGLFWTGEQAVELGLIDDLGNLYSLAREHLDDLPLQVYQTPKSPYQELAEQFILQMSTRLHTFLSTPQLH